MGSTKLMSHTKVFEGNSKMSEGSKPRVNYFISIPIRNSEILGSLKCLADQYAKQNPNTGMGITSWLKSHLTVCVFHLDESELDHAKQSLDDCAQQIKISGKE